MTKSIKFLSIVGSVFLLASCSDNLSNSKAKGILQKCYETKPLVETKILRYGDSITFDNDDLAKYMELSKSGYVAFDNINQKQYKVDFTAKADEFIKNKSGAFGSGLATVKMLEYKIEDVKSIHEIPSLNMAEAKVVYSVKNKTPFAIFLNENKIKSEGSAMLTKTSNGWECDKK